MSNLASHPGRAGGSPHRNRGAGSRLVAATETGVEVRASARLHLGFLDLNGALGRRFGSIGLAVDAPRLRLGLRRSGATRVSGPGHGRASCLLAEAVRHFGVSEGHDLRMAEAIPAHAGLGSGTQLALSIAAAVRALHGLPADPREDARLLGRGARSGIGLGLFRSGGLVVDGGRGATDAPPPVVARAVVPDAWRVLLVMDPAHEGLSGSRERAAFAALPALPAESVGRICRLVLMQALPALAEADLANFGAAITHIQETLGDHFAPAQGGRFTSATVGRAMEVLAGAGAVGIGQSSWGPTGFGFVADDAAARRAVAALGTAAGLDIMVGRALNSGAVVTTGANPA
jgi:beta-RFAP synthase